MNLSKSLSFFLTCCLFCCFLATAEGTNTESSGYENTIPTILPQTLASGFSLTAGDASASSGQLFCIEITTTGFDSIEAMQYTMAWDTAVIQFASFNVIDMPDANNFGANALPSGVMAVSWNANQMTDPPNGIYPWESVPDGTVLYEVCFTIVGEVGEFSSFDFQGTPLSIEIVTANSNGMDVGICNPQSGTITVIEPFAINNEEVTSVNCQTAGQGTINIDPTGGTLPYNFQWSGPNLFSATTEDIMNLESGIYYLTITDNSFVPQTYLDTFEVVGNFSVSIADAGADTVLNCYNNGLVELNGSFDPSDSDNSYQWFTNDGNIVSGEFTLNPDVNAAGTYYLEITNFLNFCKDTAEVVVLDNSNGPIANAGMNNELNCSQSMLNLDGTASDQGASFVYSWTTTDGNILNGDSTLIPLIDMPGNYVLTVFDQESGCSNSNSVTINQDSALPMAVAGEDTTLTCLITSIVLDGSESSSGNNFSYSWVTDDGGTILNPNTLSPSIIDPGTYFLIVTDDVNMCSDTSMVVVSESEIPPTPVDAGGEVTLTCDVFAATLDGSNTIQGAEYEYLWTTLDGNIFDGETSLSPSVDVCGTYMLEVTNTTDGCTNTDTVQVLCDTISPVIEFAPASVITCDDPVVTIDGSNSSTGTNYMYTWNTAIGNIISGNGTTSISVDISTVYGLLIEDTLTGCTALKTIFVSTDVDSPLAEAGDPMTIECGDPLMLNGTGSAVGNTISYEWSTSNGNIIMDGNETTTMPTIDVAGEYFILVSNSENGCVGVDSVLIDGASALESSAPEADANTCGTELLITGNLPGTATGIWTSTNPNDFFESPMMDTTMVLDLEPGQHTFTWTLSTVDCPDYDMGTVDVFVEGTPDAVEDEFDLSGYLTSHVINVLENDDTTIVSNWILDVVTTPDAGQVNNLGTGFLDFSFPEGYFGTSSFSYALCNDNCPDQCDTTNVLLNISEPLDTITTIPNGITPNGDGVNDEFIIPELKLTPDVYPDNEFIVFNRWGDIVFRAKPYLNDWSGTTTSGGKELPAGTYYYVIRLNVGSGAGYKGDVTILR